MLRLIGFLVAVALVAAGLAWLADRPGELILQWQGYQIETSVFRAFVLLAALIAIVLLGWSLARNVWRSPAAVGGVLARRRKQQGLEALSSGMIALGAGDKSAAMRAAIQARKSLPNEPLTHLLRAQAAQMSGDRTTARRIFEAMLASPDTEQLGLRGLFLEAERVGEREAARHFAERAVDLNPKLNWAVDALFELQCRQGDWTGALATLAVARKQGQVDRALADRRRAVLLTAQAQEVEEAEPERALSLALEAQGLAPDLVPAAAIAGRMLASRGNTPRAAKILQKTWSRSPHPDLATAYAYARIGDSPRDRLDRVKQLAALAPNSIEGPIAIATAAIEARQYDEARAALEPLLQERMTQRVATLMARVEGEQNGDKGRLREWLARAVNAPRDPAWTADGVVADRWAPTSPVTGALDAFQWKVPVENIDRDGGVLTSKLEELVKLGGPGTGEPGAGGPEADAAGAGAGGTSQASARASRAAPASDRDVPQTIEAEPVTERRPGRDKPKGAAAARTSAETGTGSVPASASRSTAAMPQEAARAESAVRAGTGHGQAREKTDRTAHDPGAFVAPHAPDDPGPDPVEIEEPAAMPLRPKPA